MTGDDHMPSTTVHIPDKLLVEMNAVIKEKGISRNRFIMEACKRALEYEAGHWPDDFFDTDVGAKNLKLLREGVDEMEDVIVKMRKNRMAGR
jgi:hypothetical protein